jgi:hypothetical protein
MNPDPQLILYPGRKGRPGFALRVEGGTVWLTQPEVADLFQTTKQNISLHIRNILTEKELEFDSVVKQSFTTAADGKNYRTKLYRLESDLPPVVADLATTGDKPIDSIPTVADSATVQSHHRASHPREASCQTLEAGGFAASSRWLSPSERATPPVLQFHIPSTPTGVPAHRNHRNALTLTNRLESTVKSGKRRSKPSADQAGKEVGG